MKRKVLLLLLTIFTYQSIYAQMGKLFDADNQLSSSYTSQVFQDRDGFIWAATRNGLNKYDGYKTLFIKKENHVNNGMASNYVNCITQDRNGLFYLGMYGALQAYDGSRFTNIEVKDLDNHVVSCYVTCFLLRKNNEVMAGTSGHGLLLISDQGHAHQIGGPLTDIHTVQDLLEDNKGNVTKDNLKSKDKNPKCQQKK